jgi:DNA-binding CsgD family transcriptional regulator
MQPTTILADRRGTVIDGSPPQVPDPARPHPFGLFPPLPVGVPCAESVPARARLRCQSLTDHRLVTISPTPTSSPTDPTLSPREREILALVARGFTSARIAKRLGLKSSTVRTHVEHIRDKLGVRTRAQAVAKATALGHVES